ncbi:hypothetical protein JIY74_34105 [Vibrio harveyi]|nr:hypothetical protein [Vibrio harveyi]
MAVTIAITQPLIPALNVAIPVELFFLLETIKPIEQASKPPTNTIVRRIIISGEEASISK